MAMNQSDEPLALPVAAQAEMSDSPDDRAEEQAAGSTT